MRRILTPIFIFFLVIILVAILVSYRTFQKSLPKTKGTVEIPALRDKVKVYRDKNGIPHIYAQNDHDLYFAMGYTIAQDRIWQLELSRRIVNGRLSEVFGDTTLAIDKFLLTLGFKRMAGEFYNHISQKSRTIINAYTDGINHFIETNEGKFPVEFMIINSKPQLWCPEDCIALSRFVIWELSLSWYVELLTANIKEKLGTVRTDELFGDYWSDWPIITSGKLDEYDFSYLRKITQQLGQITGIKTWPLGSNSWTINGSKSESGKTMLANDLHMMLSNPSRWYMAHLVAPSVNVAGFTLPGSPAIVLGFNQKIAWGFTNLMADDADFFVEQLNPSDSSQYWVNNGWQQMKVITDSIPIKGKDTEQFTIFITQNGPIINEIHQHAENIDRKISLRWTGQEFSDETLAIYKLNRAGGWEDFKRAIQDFLILNQNILYCDVAGNIGYWCCGKIPIRAGSNSMLAKERNQNWIGFVPFQELPHEFNPISGFLATANNRVTSVDYPYYISNMWEPPSRISHIKNTLQQKNNISIDDFKALQTDVYSPFARFLIPKISPELRKLNEHEKKFKQMYEFLIGWDMNVNGESVAATIFHVFFQNFLANIFYDELGKPYYQEYLFFSGFPIRTLRKIYELNLYHWFDDVHTTDHTETESEIIKKSWQDTADELEKRFGTNQIKWRWDKIHQVTFKHFLGDQPSLKKIFNIGPLPMDGSHTTINNGSYSLADPYECVIGPSMRMIVDMANPGKAEVINPPGQVGNPSSKHYRDQAQYWLNGFYITLETDSSVIRSSKCDLLELTPLSN